MTVVFFGDYLCEHTARMSEMLLDLREELGPGTLRIVFRQFPISRGGPARLAAEAALAAAAQGKFLVYHQALLERREALSREVLRELAAEIGLDPVRFEEDLDEGRFAAPVTADAEEAARFGCIGTPSYFVNGRHYRGSRSRQAVLELLRAERGRALELLQQGSSGAMLYQRLVEQGRPSL